MRPLAVLLGTGSADGAAAARTERRADARGPGRGRLGVAMAVGAPGEDGRGHDAGGGRAAVPATHVLARAEPGAIDGIGFAAFARAGEIDVRATADACVRASGGERVGAVAATRRGP